MPYIITTNYRDPSKDRYEYDVDGPMFEGWGVSRRAVATLDEAREAVASYRNGRKPLGLVLAIREVSDQGGTVGPLPDGSLITVEKVSYRYLAELGNLKPSRIRYVCDPRYGDGSPYSDEILNAYNEGASVNG